VFAFVLQQLVAQVLVSIDLIRSSFYPFSFTFSHPYGVLNLLKLKMGRRNREVNNTEEVYESRGLGKNDFSK
jgi:hypothetical protein